MIESRYVRATVNGYSELPSSQKQQKWANRGDGMSELPSTLILTVTESYCIYISTIHSLKAVFNNILIQAIRGIFKRLET